MENQVSPTWNITKAELINFKITFDKGHDGPDLEVLYYGSDNRTIWRLHLTPTAETFTDLHVMMNTGKNSLLQAGNVCFAYNFLEYMVPGFRMTETQVAKLVELVKRPTMKKVWIS